MFNDKKPADRQHGFSLVEVMIALLVFMVIMLGLAKMEISALRTHSGNVFRDEALRLAADELSRLKGLQFSLAATSDDLLAAAWTEPQDITVDMRGGSVTFARSVQITDIASSSVPLKRIDVAVGWTQGNSQTFGPTDRNHQTSLSTIIAQE